VNESNACQILFVDPDATWIDFAVRTLRGQGFSTHGVTDISQVRPASRSISEPQLVFVDREFAEQAPEQFQRLTQARNRYVVVLFSMGLEPYRISPIFKRGAYDCVDKPYDVQSLVRLVMSLVEEVCPPKLNAASSLVANCVPVA
jgi:DNA-binding NtrC family response regulator